MIGALSNRHQKVGKREKKVIAKLSKLDKKRIAESFNMFFDHFSTLDLQELAKIRENKEFEFEDKQLKLTGSRVAALDAAIRQKQSENE
jgi:hypothetical protein